MLTLESLDVTYPVPGGRKFRALKSLTLTVASGSTLAIVGESGCGKSTAARAIVGLEAPSAGRVLLEGKPLAPLVEARTRTDRQAMQMVFQDPMSSLNPRRDLLRTVAEPMLEMGFVRTLAEAKPKVEEALAEVGLPGADLSRYPHQFSGGQRQRICIARALAGRPRLIIWDEPTSALDVSVQAQVLNLIRRLQRDHGLTYIFISHDLGVVDHLAEQVAVMYMGRAVETGSTDDIMRAPRHPYTRALLASIPQLRPSGPSRRRIKGEVPDPLNPPAGCPFHPRCVDAVPDCAAALPGLHPYNNAHQVACIRAVPISYQWENA